jgi:hypothetical protein
MQPSYDDGRQNAIMESMQANFAQVSGELRQAVENLRRDMQVLSLQVAVLTTLEKTQRRMRAVWVGSIGGAIGGTVAAVATAVILRGFSKLAEVVAAL